MSLVLDPVTEERIQRQLDRGAFREPAELLSHALDLVEAEDDWLFRNREAINVALDQSFAAKERGESYSPEESKAMLSERRASRARHAE
jgi:Arc/MetJ-type ribon-helix-helix transcriptional regulator